MNVGRNNQTAVMVAGLVLVLTAGLGAVNQQIGAGMVPIPDAWKWTVPVLTAVITSLITVLSPNLRATGGGADADGVVTIMAPMDRPGELAQVPRATYDALVAEGYPTIESGALRVVQLPATVYARQRLALAGG